MHIWQASTELPGVLTPLQQLSGLERLSLHTGPFVLNFTSCGSLLTPDLEALCRLTGLKALDLYDYHDHQRLLQLTHLRQLTSLVFLRSPQDLDLASIVEVCTVMAVLAACVYVTVQSGCHLLVKGLQLFPNQMQRI
jgi:hypothetical protein